MISYLFFALFFKIKTTKEMVKYILQKNHLKFYELFPENQQLFRVVFIECIHSDFTVFFIHSKYNNDQIVLKLCSSPENQTEMLMLKLPKLFMYFLNLRLVK